MRTIKQIEALINDGRMSEGEALQYIIDNFGNENDNFDKFPVIEEFCEVEQAGQTQVVTFSDYSCSGEIVDWEWERQHINEGAVLKEDGNLSKRIYHTEIYQFIDGQIKIVKLYDILKEERSYDVVFDCDTSANNKGFSKSLAYCKDFIATYNGTDYSYFADYKGGTVSIVCNETGETVYSEAIK